MTTLAQGEQLPDTNDSLALPADIEKQSIAANLKLDIEHATVHDDPREWSSSRKMTILVIVSFAAMVAGLSANIQNGKQN